MLSIVFSFCYGIIGIILGIVGLVLANKATEMHEMNPGMYSQSSLSNAKAGKITSIIGLVLGALVILYFIFILVMLGTLMGDFPWEEFR
ncbi:MAG: hypothetical protein C0592_02450 [Marinilabiliales bacterium]|nr:MAG: hypothetical protein C0592_02450 [Marinilabiliales bacterium]